jgi:hypothetical protein
MNRLQCKHINESGVQCRFLTNKYICNRHQRFGKSYYGRKRCPHLDKFGNQCRRLTNCDYCFMHSRKRKLRESRILTNVFNVEHNITLTF